MEVGKTAPTYTSQPGPADVVTHRHTAANMSRGNIPAAHLATPPSGREDAFIVKREREGAKNEAFLNLKIPTKTKNKTKKTKTNKDCINKTLVANKYFILFQGFSYLLFQILTSKRAAGF